MTLTQSDLIQMQIKNASDARAFHLKEAQALRLALRQHRTGTAEYNKCADEIDQHIIKADDWAAELNRLRWS